MARGFESKSVTSQQESALDPPLQPEGAPADPAIVRKRRFLELSRADVLRHLESARAEAHRATLTRALEALDRELAELP